MLAGDAAVAVGAEGDAADSVQHGVSLDKALFFAPGRIPYADLTVGVGGGQLLAVLAKGRLVKGMPDNIALVVVMELLDFSSPVKGSQTLNVLSRLTLRISLPSARKSHAGDHGGVA